MPELNDLYQDIILDHNRNPRNFRRIEDANRRADGDNPICGDRVTVYARMDGDVVADISFEGSGCAISRASASLMTAGVRGKTRAEAEQLFREFHALLTGGETPSGTAGLGKLIALGGVRAFPARVKCASLPWHTMQSALGTVPEAVSTE